MTLTPNVILSDGNNSIQGPWALVFDSAGNLWLSNANAPSTVVEFAKASLATAGSPIPIVTLIPTTIRGTVTLAAPNEIAFDNQGALAAVSSATPFGVAFFGRNRLAKGGAIPPYSLIVDGNTTLNAPAGCNFGPFIWQ